MSHSYSTPPSSASRHLHFAMCTEDHRIYGHVLSKPLTLQTFQKHFLRFPMTDSCPSLDVNPDRPYHQLEPGTRQHCFSTPAHSSDHRLTTCALVCHCVPCLPHASPLSPRRASAILAKISWVAHPHHLKPHCRSISHTRPMPSSTPSPDH